MMFFSPSTSRETPLRKQNFASGEERCFQTNSETFSLRLKPRTGEQVFLDKFLDEFTYASVPRTSFPLQALFVPVYAKFDNIFS